MNAVGQGGNKRGVLRFDSRKKELLLRMVNNIAAAVGNKAVAVAAYAYIIYILRYFGKAYIHSDISAAQG